MIGRRRNGVPLLPRAIGALLLLAALGHGGLLLAAPFVPADDAMVLERGLPSADPRVRLIRRFAARLAARPDDLQLAMRLAEIQLAMGVAEADPRFIGNAEASLARWWHDPAPVALLVLRGRIFEAKHAYADAQRELRAALKADSGNIQALIVLANVDDVTGDLAEAESACATVARLRPGLLATACLASVDSLTGHAAQSYRRLKEAVERQPSLNTDVQIWALTILGEIGWRLDEPDADRFFKAALAFDRRNIYVLTTYADYLRDHGRFGEIPPLLHGMKAVEPLYLRLALAAQALGDARLSAYRKDLAARYEEARRQGDILHLRGAARFALGIEHDPRQAVALATRNWAVQHAPVDARVLVEAAWAAHDPAAARPIAEWVAKTHLEDKMIARRLDALGFRPQG
ncbi:MAG TPA: hypothetical protein VJ770_04600 [Stellaceae bacterium]|nr:hypothetical protein [Stellaceae bacterium]